MDPRTTSHLDLSNVSCPLVKIHPVHHESNGRLSHPVYLHLLPGNQSKVIRICSWFEWYGQVRLWVRSPLVRVNIVNNVSSGWYDMKQDGGKLCLMNYRETYSRLITVNLLTYHFKSTEFILQIGSFLNRVNCIGSKFHVNMVRLIRFAWTSRLTLRTLQCEHGSCSVPRSKFLEERWRRCFGSISTDLCRLHVSSTRWI